MSGLSLDLRLGLRMVVKYPGLTLVGGLGMAAAIAVGAGYFSFIAAVTDPALPLDEGDRVVAIQNMDAAAGGLARGTHLHDLETWRESFHAVEDLGAYRTVIRNVVTPNGQVGPIQVAEMSAAGFGVARVPPLLGRYLLDEDERVGAPPVVVIGHDVWQERFGGDPGVVGRSLRLGDEPYTVVGVMPEGFAFPVNHHLWTPLQLAPLDFGRGSAPAIEVFGRLAPGVSLEQAQAQLTALGRQTAAAHPGTHRHVRPRIVPYALSSFDDPGLAWALHLVQLVVSMLLVVIAVNVAILVYARTATRAGEIAVRLALGAGRGRIVTQLFAEALVLALLSAAVGLGVARFALRQVELFMSRPTMAAGWQAPFWWRIGISPGSVLYVAGLAVLAAVIVGVVPALKATRGEVQASLRELGGATGMRMGRTWTALIVVQVAVAVAILPPTSALVWSEIFPDGITTPGFDADGLVSAELGLQPETPPAMDAEGERRAFAARLADRQRELVSRLEAEPGVAGVSFTSEVAAGVVEIEGARPGEGPALHSIRYLQLGPGLFDVFGAEVVAGRSFAHADVAGEASAAVVNRSFAEQMLGGDALGRRFRYVHSDDDIRPGGVEEGGWYEIVGVVNDFPVELPYRWQGYPTLYHPVGGARPNPVKLVVRTRGMAPERLAGRIREVTLAVDPTLWLGEVRTVARSQREEAWTRQQVSLAIVVGALCVVLLSAAGIHALTSFMVVRRRREIGIRAALGARPRHILASVFSRAAAQLGAGVAIGGILGTTAVVAGGYPADLAAVLLIGVAALMLAVGLLAALGPARRGLRIQPMEALKEE